ncbi:MAG: Crp/Fnr family transcriptional regulator [Runella sp.]
MIDVSKTHQAFTGLLRSFLPLDDQAIAFTLQQTQILQCPRNTLLLGVGQVCHHLYFLHHGLARGFYHSNKQEFTSWFAKENDIVFSPHSFLRQQPTDEGIELLEDTLLLSLSYKAVQQIYERFPMMNTLGRLITDHYLLQYDERFRFMQALGGKERLREFMARYPTLYDRASNKHIASYLGMTPETMSRLLAKKN